MLRLREWTLAGALLLLLAGCTQPATPTPTPAATPLPPVGVLQAGGGAVQASGKIVPADTADLAFVRSGRVANVAVDVGDAVPAQGLLLALDSVAEAAALTQAQAAYFRTQANLSELQAGARSEEIAAAAAQVAAAQARLEQASEQARAADVAAARADLAAAQAAQQQLFGGPRESDRIAALATLSNANAALQQAQSAYNRVSWRDDIGALPESRQLQEATNNYESAQARYDALYADPDADLTASARARVQAAQAALDRLLAPATQSRIAELEAQVDAAQAQLDLLKAGARAEALAVAAVAVTDAGAVLQRAQADLANTELRAPFTGTVTALNISLGELAATAAPVVTLADLDRLQAETTDLSERDVARVRVGQPATVLIEPLNVTVPGRVARISPQANIIGGDVVYTVLIDLDEQPAEVRWGMSVEVDIATDQ